MASRAWIALGMLGAGCAGASGSAPVVDDIDPGGAHVAAVTEIDIHGSNFARAPLVDLDDGTVMQRPEFALWIERDGNRIDLTDVSVHDGGRRIHASVPADIAGGYYDLVVQNANGDMATVAGGWAAADVVGVEIPDVSGVVPDLPMAVRLVNAAGDEAALSLWDYELAVSTDSVDITMSQTTLTLGSATSAIIDLQSTLAHTALGSLAINQTSPNAPPITIDDGTIEWLAASPNMIVVSNMTTADLNPVDVPIAVTDVYGNEQPSHGGVTINWLIEQSQHPIIPEKPAGPTGTLIFSDGVSVQTINLDPSSTPGEVEVGLESASQPWDQCFGLICFGGVGCGTLVPTGCISP